MRGLAWVKIFNDFCINDDVFVNDKVRNESSYWLVSVGDFKLRLLRKWNVSVGKFNAERVFVKFS